MDGLQPIAGGCMGGRNLLVHTHGELYHAAAFVLVVAGT